METQRLRDSEIEELSKITRRIIGAAIEVHRVLGPGLLEPLYEKALCAELEARSIKYMRQITVPAHYKQLLLGEHRIDLIVEDAIVVEVKSAAKIIPLFEVQLRTYLRLTGKRLGLILNFNAPLMIDGVSRVIA